MPLYTSCAYTFPNVQYSSSHSWAAFSPSCTCRCARWLRLIEILLCVRSWFWTRASEFIWSTRGCFVSPRAWEPPRNLRECEKCFLLGRLVPTTGAECLAPGTPWTALSRKGPAVGARAQHLACAWWCGACPPLSAVCGGWHGPRSTRAPESHSMLKLRCRQLLGGAQKGSCFGGSGEHPVFTGRSCVVRKATGTLLSPPGSAGRGAPSQATWFCLQCGVGDACAHRECRGRVRASVTDGVGGAALLS